MGFTWPSAGHSSKLPSTSVEGNKPLSYQAPFSVGGEAAVAPSSPKDISIWSAVSSVFVRRRSRYVRETRSGSSDFVEDPVDSRGRFAGVSSFMG